MIVKRLLATTWLAHRPRSNARSPRRVRRSWLYRETRLLAVGALAMWLVAGGALAGWAASGDVTGSAPRNATVVSAPLADKVLARRGAQLAADPVIGPALSSWWNVAGEPVDGLGTRATPPKPPRRLDLAARLAALEPTPAAGSLAIPILMYHYTPGDFDAQLTHLEQRGYQVVDLDAAVAGLAGSALPPKPVVITFDDGFADQMTAYNILAAHRMRATFYIINGSAKSLWCIGANRRLGDPLQPPTGCGDAYLTWDQIRYLDSSGLITIGGHTIDHPNLTAIDRDELKRQIAQSKAEIQEQLGHPIDHFAYPYGAYNADVAAAVQAAGYSSAVTVNPGMYQTFGGRFGLYRLRTAYDLP